MTDITADSSTRRDVKVIALVATAHGCSHFYQLVLPPLFPFITQSLGMDYAEAGLLVACFYAVSGLAQTPAGFLVDRFGARRVLLGGLALAATAVALMSLMSSFWVAIPLVVAAGLGNCVFHPADYSILSHTVSKSRMARAYGVHTLSGNIGWAAAPVTMLALAGVAGWRGALAIAGLAGLGVVLFLVSQSGILDTGRAMRAAPAATFAKTPRASTLSLLTSGPILLCFAYFVLLSVSLTGNQTFMPAALNQLYGTSLATAGAALSAYLLAGSLGVLVGGIAADRTQRHDGIVAAGLLVAATIMLVVGFVPLADTAIITAVALAGFASGITTPSRDMLVRGATPPGATGKVFGFVYSGLDLGAAVTPPVLGFFLDRGEPRMVFVLAATALTLTIATAFRVGKVRAARMTRAEPAPAE
ncbi:MAG TPA: MFS transporter [Stellaceae bacterium]|nr:MFS transporter [Stellaceae bacterium]